MLFIMENKSRVGGGFNISYLKEGQNVAFLPMPNKILRLIGQVIIYWGLFEVQLDSLIASALTAVKRDEPGWNRQGFAKRKKLFVDLVKSDLEPSFPAAAARYRKIAGDAADLYWRRNIVAHGAYRVTFPPAGDESPYFWAEGVHNGRDVKIDIDEPTLEKLWHDISHLTGGLVATVPLHGSVSGEWPMTFSDTEILRVHRESSPRLNPNPKTRPPQS